MKHPSILYNPYSQAFWGLCRAFFAVVLVLTSLTGLWRLRNWHVRVSRYVQPAQMVVSWVCYYGILLVLLLRLLLLLSALLCGLKPSWLTYHTCTVALWLVVGLVTPSVPLLSMRFVFVGPHRLQVEGNVHGSWRIHGRCGRQMNLWRNTAYSHDCLGTVRQICTQFSQTARMSNVGGPEPEKHSARFCNCEFQSEPSHIHKESASRVTALWLVFFCFVTVALPCRKHR